MQLPRQCSWVLLSPIVAALLVGVPSAADSTQLEQQDIAEVEQWRQDAITVSRARIALKRQALVTRAMQLTEQERGDFWNLYRTYTAQIEAADDRMFDLITDYGATYRAGESLSNAQAERMLQEYFAIEQAKLNVRKRFAKRFRRVLPAKKVARLFQLENKIDALVRMDLAGDVPLIW